MIILSEKWVPRSSKKNTWDKMGGKIKCYVTVKTKNRRQHHASAATAEISLPVGEVPLSPYNFITRHV